MARRDLGALHLARRDYASAEPLLLEAYEVLRTARGPHFYAAAEAQEHLGTLYRAWNRPEKLRALELRFADGT